ncbi:MAG: undecaprenyl-diphosphate phosphatase [Actinomycetota bacterium]
MSVFQALILGIVQGLTEFLPISSSGHLTLVPFIAGWPAPTLAFAVAVHIGTLVAVAAVFRAEIAMLARTALGWKRAPESDRSLLRMIVIGTIPAAIIGITLEKVIGGAFERPVLVSLLLGVTGYFLMSTETIVETREAETVPGAISGRPETELTTADALAVGFAQAVSILPGISRSGSTIGTGMRMGLSRVGATRFSFLLSIPIIFGAALAETPSIMNEGFGTGAGTAFAIGIASSAISGFLAVRWFIGTIQRRGLRPFGIYCFLMMVAGLVTALARG